MPPTNVGRLGIAIQSAKGTRSSTVLYWIDLTGGGMRPTPNIETRAETGAGRDVGDQFISQMLFSGDPSFLLRRKVAALWYYATLGTKAVTQLGTIWSSGQTYTTGQLIRPVAGGKLFEVTTPGTSGTTEPAFAGVTTVGQTINSTGGVAVYTLRQLTNYYEHLLTPANDQPYCTLWLELGDSLYLVCQDVKITQANLEFAGGGDLAVAGALQGLQWERLAASPGGGTYETGYAPFRRPGSVLKLGGVQDTTIASGNLNVEAGVNTIQTDNIYPDYVEPGARTIAFGLEAAWVSVARWAQVYTGTAAGTQPGLDLFESTMDLKFGPDYGPQIVYTLQRALYTEANPNGPDPAANPLMLSIAGGAGRVSSGNILEVRVRNDVASYAST